MATIEVSAIYKADQDGFHLDDQAKAIFEAHGGEWVDQNTCYGGPMHLDRTITYQMPVEQVGAVKLALEQACFRVAIQECLTVEKLIEILNQDPTESSWETVNKVLPPILDAAAGWCDNFDSFSGTPYVDFGLSDDALQLACLAVRRLAGSIDKDVATREITDLMGALARCLLIKNNLSPDIRARLERIRDTGPEPSEDSGPATGP